MFRGCGIVDMNGPRSRRDLLLAVLLAVLFASSVSALEVPYLSGRVIDTAGLLSPAAVDQLGEQLRVLEEGTGAQVVVLTIPSLEGDSLEDFSLRVVETWKLGRADVDDGVLVLIARDDRKMRIEVGYGLEGALTDAQSGRIIDRVMAPRFRAGDFDGGVAGAVEAVSAAIRGEELPLPEPQTTSTGFDPAGLIVFFIFGLPFIGGALSTKGVSGWIMGFFLTPFFFIIPAVIFGVRIGALVAVLWLVVFPILRIVTPKSSGTSGGGFWGPIVGSGGGGGGFSGGGFSGGGGSFGGGGASGGW
jgi:uncharacterized protein